MSEEGIFRNFDDLPIEVAHHCLVLVAGMVRYKDSLANTYLYNINQRKWKRMQNMTNAWAMHSWSLLKDEEMLVSIGGLRIEDNLFLQSTEFYSLKTGEWIQGPNLLKNNWDSQMFTSNGGCPSADIYRLDKLKTSMWKWTLVGKLSKAKHFHSVTPILLSSEDCEE